MRSVTRLVRPLAWVLSKSTDGVLALFRIAPVPAAPISEEEIKHMIAEGVQSGMFAEQERDIVARVFRFADRKAWEIMTPREQIFWLDAELSNQFNLHKLSENRHSRFPLCRGKLDNVIGIVYAKDVIGQIEQWESVVFDTIAVKPLFVDREDPAFVVLNKFKEHKRHIALVSNSNRHIEGIITDNDILDAVVGNIKLHSEAHQARMVRRTDGSWLVDGDLAMQACARELGLDRIHLAQLKRFQRVRDFVHAHFSEDPTVADTFVWEGYRFEIVDLDGDVIDTILVQAIEH
jgi:putative hemolysin